MPGLPLGPDFTNVLKKRHQEITVKESVKTQSSPATSPTSEKIPSKPEKPSSDSKPEWLKNLAATKRKSAFIDDKVNITTEATKPLSPGDSDDNEKNSPKIMPKASVKDRMRNFQNFDSGKNDKNDDKNNSSTSSAIKNRFGKSVIKDKIPETVESKPSQVKRTISPPIANNINTSSSTANTSTDSTESNLSSKVTTQSKIVPENNSTLAATTLTGNLTLPQLSKLIQQQSQLISDLQLENKQLNKRVDDLERLVKR